MLLIRRVHGASMLPTLRHGQLVFGFRSPRISIGDVVVVRHEGLEKIKRVADVQDDLIAVRGDNLAASTDSRHFGLLPKKAVVAKIFWPRGN